MPTGNEVRPVTLLLSDNQVLDLVDAVRLQREKEADERLAMYEVFRTLPREDRAYSEFVELIDVADKHIFDLARLWKSLLALLSVDAEEIRQVAARQAEPPRAAS